MKHMKGYVFLYFILTHKGLIQLFSLIYTNYTNSNIKHALFIHVHIRQIAFTNNCNAFCSTDYNIHGMSNLRMNKLNHRTL